MDLSSSILFTFLYGDIFQYPYTLDELVAWMPKNTWSEKAIQNRLAYLVKKKKIFYRAPFYGIHGHDAYIRKRQNRERYAAEKWKKAARAARILGLIPTVRLVGITGGLSILNADKKDDIDFYICTSIGTVWITRLFATILMELFAVRRRPGSIEVKDAICLNMFVSEASLGVFPKDRDIFAAHEVLQMQPLWERGNTYAKFLKKNAWVSFLFPHKWGEVIRESQPKVDRLLSHGQRSLTTQLMQLLEKPVRYIQIVYMKKRRTNEIITDTVIRFHPRDARVWIFRALRSSLKHYHLPLDKKFFRT